MLGSLVITTAALGTLLVPLWMLVLGPLVWGTPHLVSDLRYLVVVPGLHRRRGLWLTAGVPLALVAAGADLVWGWVGTVATAACARASVRRRTAVVLAATGCAVSFVRLGTAADIVFGHLHNFAAVALWWGWRPRRLRLHWGVLGLLLAVLAFLLSPLAPGGVDATGAVIAGPDGGLPVQLGRLAPGLDADLGLRVVLSFCFMQSVHYAIWMRLLPDEASARETPITWRASVESLRDDLGTAAIVVAVVLWLAIAAWAIADLYAAGDGYFRMARFHGVLELMAGVVLIAEGRSCMQPTARPRLLRRRRARGSRS